MVIELFTEAYPSLSRIVINLPTVLIFGRNTIEDVFFVESNTTDVLAVIVVSIVHRKSTRFYIYKLPGFNTV
jgi:hypothetical protein